MDLQVVKAVADLQSQSHLLGVPFEVLLQIASYLTTVEYGNFRRACRHIEVSLYTSFVREFFARRSFALTEFSLETLVDISKSRLGSGLTHLIVSLDRPPSVGIDDPDSSLLYNTLAFKHNVARAEYVNHQTLISSGQDVELLAEALLHLPNLEKVGMRDFYSGWRDRDPVNGVVCPWTSYGAQTFFRETGCHLEFPEFVRDINPFPDDTNTSYVSHTFSTILRALGKAKATCSPPKFEVILRKSHLPEASFNLPRYIERTVLPVLKGLTCLFLDLGQKSFSCLVVQNESRHEVRSSLLLATFLSKMSAVEHLRLNFRDCSHEFSTDILSWLAETPYPTLHHPPPPTSTLAQRHIPTFPQTPEFPHLEQLDIGMVEINAPMLLGIYMRYKPTKISLHKVALIADTNNIKANQWVWLFTQIAKSNLKLSAIKLSWIGQMRRGISYPMRFRQPVYAPIGSLANIHGWSGSDFKRDAKEFIDSICFTDSDDYSEDDPYDYNPDDADEPTDDDDDEDNDDDDDDEMEEADDVSSLDDDLIQSELQWIDPPPAGEELNYPVPFLAGFIDY